MGVALDEIAAAMQRVKLATKRVEEYPEGADAEVARMIALRATDQEHWPLP